MTAILTPGKRGHKGPGGGAHTYMQDVTWHRGPSSHLAGFNPWVVGNGVTNIGIPLGRIQSKRGRVGVLHCDPISWFERAELISSPSAFVLGLNGLGKSSLLRRWMIGSDGYGIPSMVPADVKGEHVATIRALGGQVVQLGRGRGRLNVLDLTEVYRQAKRLSPQRGAALLALARARRQAAAESLFIIDWGRAITGDESHILAEALQVMDAAVWYREPEMDDLRHVIVSAPESVQDIALTRGDMVAYRQLTRSLESSLVAWCKGHGLGEVFAGPSTVRLVRGKSVAIDISGIDMTDTKLMAAAMVASWNAGFTQVAIAHALDDEGLEPYRPVMIYQDELWRVLQFPGMVGQFDSLTRLDRNEGVGRVLVSHSLGDGDSLVNRQDRIKAAGFFARSGIKMLFGLPESEMSLLEGALRLSDAEREYLVNNTTQETWNPTATSQSGHPGEGKILCKTGAGKPGIPFHLDLTPAELGAGGLNDTNLRWNMR